MTNSGIMIPGQALGREDLVRGLTREALTRVVFGNSPFGDIFETLFGNAGYSRGGEAAHGPQKGSDLRLDMTIAFEEAATGVEREVTITRKENCSTCGGSGAAPGTSRKKCPSCGGSGRVRSTQSTPFGQFPDSGYLFYL